MTTYRGAIIGAIWQPTSAPCSLEVSPFDADSDEQALALMHGRKAGDFSGVLGVELWRIESAYETADDERIVKITVTDTLIKQFSEYAADAYNGTLPGDTLDVEEAVK